MQHYLHLVNNLNKLFVKKTNLPLRALAARIINTVIVDNKSLTTTLPQYIAQLPSEKEHGLLKEICFGTLRWFHRINYISQQLIKIPLKQKDQDIFVLILIGLYQLLYLRIPQHAVVSETVAAAYALKKPWAAKLINGVLRNFLRESQSILSIIEENPVAHFSHPSWLIENIQSAWPFHWKTTLENNNQHPPFSCRVNAKQYTREEYISLLHAQEIPTSKIDFTTHGIIIDSPRDVHQLPEFVSGALSVQDGAAQLAAILLDVAAGYRILDACAAPGGKTTHILEIQPGIEKLIAIDIDENRLLHLQENLSRTENHAEIIVGDAAQPNNWWDGKLFDRILCDAPCSATGVIRRHPDIKLLRRETDIAQLIEQQWQLLNALWPLLKQDGILLYATCSILPAENSDLLKRFIATHDDAQEEVITAQWGIKQDIGRQILTGMHNMDGFYYAKIKKINK